MNSEGPPEPRKSKRLVKIDLLYIRQSKIIQGLERRENCIPDKSGLFLGSLCRTEVHSQEFGWGLRNVE